MSESISQLPVATQANATDLIPATQGSIGPGTGTTRAVTQAQIIAAGGTATSNLTLDAGGGWSSNNVGKQLLVTTPAAASNPGIGITDSNGLNLWGVWNHAGVLTMSVMPAYSDNLTGPTNIAAFSSTGLSVTGTLSSSGALTVSSGVSAFGGGITVNPNAGTPTIVLSGDGSTFVSAGSTTAHPVLFVTNNVERSRLDSNGNFYFATSNISPVTANVTGISAKSSPGTSSMVQISNPAGPGLAIGTNTSGGTLLPWFYGGVQVANIAMVGNGVSVAYNTSSDYRLKLVYGPADTGALIDAVPVYDAAFEADLSVRRPMFLAHELQAAAPWSVTGDKDAVDAEGQIIRQLVDHPVLVPAIWAELQSLRRRVKALEG